MRLFRRSALAAAALLVFGCTTQPAMFAPGPAAPFNFQGQSRPVSAKLVEYSGNFQPTFENSFLSMRPLVQSGYTVLKVRYSNQQQINQLNEIGMDVWMVTPQHVLGQVNDEVFQRLQDSRLPFELISPERGVSAANTFDPQYHTYDEMLQKLRSVTQRHSQIASLHDIGDTWEKTQGQANRDIWAVRLSGQGNPDQKPGILFLGNHHARELATVEIPLLLIDLLTENYGKDPDITRLMDTRDIWLVPMVNPDGHILAEQGQNWRKNTHVHGRHRGTDLNRNYSYQWGGGGASTSPSSDTYRGEAPFSEPETQAVRNLLTSRRNLKVMMSYHSFSNLILWPWGYTTQRVPNAKLVEIGQKLGQMTGYRPQQAADLYVASGMTDDFTYGELGLYSYTTEIGSWGDGFDPPYSRVKDFWNENRDAALYLIDMAGKL